MTILSDFIQEIARELGARTDKPLAPHHWISFVKLLEMGELRQQMEQVSERSAWIDLGQSRGCYCLI